MLTSSFFRSDDHSQLVRSLQTVLDNLLDAVVVINQQGSIVYFSRPAEEMFGYRGQDIIGQDVGLLMPEAEATQHQHYLARYLATGERHIIGFDRELEARKADKTLFPVNISITETKLDNELFFIGTIRDLTKERALDDKIRHLSFYDDTTGLPNRMKILAEVKQRLQQEALCVAALNLDFFNRIHTVYGASEAEQVVLAVSQRLHHRLHSGELLGRDLEDRFWVLIPARGVGEASCLQRAEALLEVVREPFTVRGQVHYLTASIGLSVDDRETSAAELLAHAETAVHQAKRDGRDQVSVYRNIMTAQIVEEYRLERDLRQAIHRGELQCYIQSQVGKSGLLVAGEALVRWHKADGEMVQPDAFIPLAERLGMINDIGAVVARQVARVLRQARQCQPDIRLAMNVSPKQFLSSTFVQGLKEIFAAEQAPLSGLVLELTENLLVREPERVNRTVTELTKLGVQLSIDDFGTGYSNIQRLQQLDIAELKIDRQFVHNFEQDKRQRAILETIILMARSLGLACVAEGVETSEQAEYLQAQGCDLLQGFYYHRPEPASDWLESLASV